ncbi:hypothetical protein SM61_05363 [Klebsiella pneumoniae]|uniref:hypothetical protein n=1 Tax=Enterobacteriaceae TaxID=543 RepID=UPI000659441B|nr:hypothetical protein [Klebsiella pneumoniae]KMG77272.1 hypothetical protein SM61_05363 [Klebsiella pneumoniae]
MFTAFNERNDFSYAFEKIRNAISAPGENNLYAATELGLGILLRKYEQFRQELDAAGELGNWEYDLDTYNHCIAVLQRYFTGNPSGLTEPRQPGGCKLKTAPVRPVVAARPAEYVCSEDLFY